MKELLMMAIMTLAFVPAGSWASPAQLIPNEPQVIGGETDEHGCIIPAGYSWCEESQKCLRAWEEPCGPAQEKDANYVLFANPFMLIFQQLAYLLGY